MARVTGTFRFKTEDELINSGWKWMGSYYEHPDSGCFAPVPLNMIAELGGERIRVVDGLLYPPWSNINDLMVGPPEEEIVDKILIKYSTF